MRRMNLVGLILLIIAALVVGLELSADPEPCKDGHGGGRKCHACGCGGNDRLMKKDPKEKGGNSKYPNHVCRQACSPHCCSCVGPDGKKPLPPSSEEEITK